MARKRHLTLLLVAVSAFLGFSLLLAFRNLPKGVGSPSYQPPAIPVSDGILHGEASAPKLENDTLKAELGNAAWKVLHTTMAKFPDKPTAEESSSLKAYIYLFARLYPCGDCARHFQQLLAKYPPQVASRSTAAAWACHVHNEVNKKLKKELFDCTKIGDFYDCGCAEDQPPSATHESMTERFTPLELDKEGLTRGG